MRITAELISKSASFTNCLGDRELDLRLNKIANIENLSVTKDACKTIDLTDNFLIALDNFPPLPSLHTLLASNNQITKIDARTPSKLSNLQTLVLNNNPLDDVEQLTCLSQCTHLRHLSLIDCPISRQPRYRQKVLGLIPQLKTLDFRFVRARERANALSASDNSPQTQQSKSNNQEPPKKKTKIINVENIKEQIKNAQSIDEINHLERLLLAGQQ